MPSPPPQPVPTKRVKAKLHTEASSSNIPQPARTGASPMSYGGMTGISFTNGGGFSFGDREISVAGYGGTGATPRSFKWSNGVGSYGARFYGEAGDSPTFSSSITMEPSSFAISSAAFNLPLSASYRRSYASALSGRDTITPNTLSTSLASLSHHPTGALGTSYSTSYSRSQLANMMSLRTDAELTKDYECCGTQHQGLHALLEHVEDAHTFSDSDANMGGFSPVTQAMDLDLEGLDIHTGKDGSNGNSESSRSSLSPNLSQAIPNFPLARTTSNRTSPLDNATVFENLLGSSPTQLELSDVLTSPMGDSSLGDGRSSFLSATRTATTSSTSSSPPDASLPTPTTSSHPSPVLHAPKINPSTGRVGASFLGAGADLTRTKIQQIRFERGFNEVVAGGPVGVKIIGGDEDENRGLPGPTAVAPGVLFGSAVAGLGIPTGPSGSMPGRKGQSVFAKIPTTTSAGSSTPQVGTTSGQSSVTPSTAPGTPASAGASGSNFKLSEPPLPSPSLFTTHKPWRCPNPGCNKAYKQSNGLKYHQQKGMCDFQIHDAVDRGLTVEEAEERSRPFVCAVGSGCNKRYRQMNGLKYHYLNSGEHGEYGLRMIQNGSHPHPPTVPTPPTKTRPFYSNTTYPSNGLPTSSSNSKSASSSTTTTSGFHPTPSTTRPNGTAPYAIPSHVTVSGNGVRPVGTPTQGPRLGTWPSNGQSNGRLVPGSTARPVSSASGGARPAAAFSHPAQKPLPPVQRGREAVLFSAVLDGSDA